MRRHQLPLFIDNLLKAQSIGKFVHANLKSKRFILLSRQFHLAPFIEAGKPTRW
jgi:hypothetical protein